MMPASARHGTCPFAKNRTEKRENLKLLLYQLLSKSKERVVYTVVKLHLDLCKNWELGIVNAMVMFCILCCF